MDELYSRKARLVILLKYLGGCWSFSAQYFGYTVNNKGFKVLPDQVRALWGDGINISDMDKMMKYTKTAGHRKTGLLAWVEDFFKKLTEILPVSFKCSAQKYDDKWHDVQKRPLDMLKASKKGVCL